MLTLMKIGDTVNSNERVAYKSQFDYIALTGDVQVCGNSHFHAFGQTRKGFFLGTFLEKAIEIVKRRNSRLREASKYTLDTISPLKGAGQVGNATPSFGSLRGLRPVGSAVEAMTQGQTPKYHQSLKARNKHSRVSNELDSRMVICRKAGLIPLASGKLVTLRTNMRYLAIGCLVSRLNLRAGMLW